MFELVRTLYEDDRTSDFVAIACQEAHVHSHSLIIIQKDSKLYQFDFISEVSLKDIEDDCYHKVTNVIDSDLVPSFLTYCKVIAKRAKPKFGFFYSGEYYDSIGNYSSTSNVGETMTCVGFCLNVLKGFLNEQDYIKYQDWDESSYALTPDYLEDYVKEHNLKIEDISASHRRITPLELLTSAFFTKLPIRKKDIDSKIEYVRETIKD